MAKISEYIERWRQIKKTVYYHNFMVFLCFVAVSAVFLVIMALNDNGQEDFDVELKIVNIPQNVTFIVDAPTSIHANVRDKGTNLMRKGVLKKPVMQVNFNEYVENGIFRMTPQEISSALRSIFGTTAQISAVSVDSIRLPFTTNPGKKVHLVIDADVTPSVESTIDAEPYATTGSEITVYGDREILDTITNVYTEKIVRHNLSESLEFHARIRPIPGVRIVPDKVTVVVAVEPLVLKYSSVDIIPKNVPQGESLLLFPAKAEVSYFAPMSQFEATAKDIVVVADYSEISQTGSDKIKISIESSPEQYVNLKLTNDSVEYTIVKKM